MFNDVFSDVSYAGFGMRGEILGAERRRFWHDDDKLEIVMSVGIGGASVTQVAQHREIRRQQIYAWPHDLKKMGFGRLILALSFTRWMFQSRPGFR